MPYLICMERDYQYKSIASQTTSDFRDRGSKFFGFSFPVSSTDDIKAVLQGLKKEYPKAVHHCYAWRLGTDGTQYRANDDGEPAGSAGKPILGQIDSAELTNVLVVVVRYFGGTLLGVPGLINAYKVATAEALQKAEVLVKNIEDIVSLEFDYPAMGEVLYLLRQSEATIYQQDLQLFCTVKAGIPKKVSEGYVAKLKEIRGVKVV